MHTMVAMIWKKKTLRKRASPEPVLSQSMKRVFRSDRMPPR
jgi:hypothetical protein